jgi:hypothetical protein
MRVLGYGAVVLFVFCLGLFLGNEAGYDRGIGVGFNSGQDIGYSKGHGDGWNAGVELASRPANDCIIDTFVFGCASVGVTWDRTTEPCTLVEAAWDDSGCRTRD